MERYGFIEKCIEILEKDALNAYDSEKLFIVRKASVELLQLTSNVNDEEVIPVSNVLSERDQSMYTASYDFATMKTSGLKDFVDSANKNNYEIISMTDDQGELTILYKKRC